MEKKHYISIAAHTSLFSRMAINKVNKLDFKGCFSPAPSPSFIIYFPVPISSGSAAHYFCSHLPSLFFGKKKKNNAAEINFPFLEYMIPFREKT